MPASHIAAHGPSGHVSPVYEALVCATCPARKSDVCGELTDPELRELTRATMRHAFEPGDTLVWDGDPATHAFVVTRGALRLAKTGADGRRQILGFLFPGDIVAFPPGESYKVNLESLSKGEVCRFERSRLETAMQKFPKLDQGYRRTTARALEGAYGLAFTLGRRTAIERVANFLMDLRSGSCPKAPGGALNLPMTRQDIADFLGLTIETVSRAFSRLKLLKVIRLPSNQEVEILDTERLAALSGNEAAL
jgi:CRP/FNR family transcriptional regulator